MITSDANPLLKMVRRLQRASRERRRRGLFVAEGVHLAQEALAAAYLPTQVLLAEDAVSEAKWLAEAFTRQGVPVTHVGRQAFRSVSDLETPQGILLLLPIRELSAPLRPDFVLIPDGVRDPGNLGTLMRTALAAGVQLLWLPPGNVDVYHPKVVRAAMGAHFRLPVRTWDWTTIAAHRAGLRFFLAEARRGVPCYQANFRSPLALIIGGEAGGAGMEARQLAADTVHIPMPGPVESLNAAVAAGVLLFEVVRQRRAASERRYRDLSTEERS